MLAILGIHGLMRVRFVESRCSTMFVLSSSRKHVAMWEGDDEGKGGTRGGSEAHKTNRHATINANVRMNLL